MTSFLPFFFRIKKEIKSFQHRVQLSSKHLQHLLVRNFTSHGGSKTGNQLPHSTVEVVQLGWRGPQLLQLQSWGLFRRLLSLSHLWFRVPLLSKKIKPKTYTTLLISEHAVRVASLCRCKTAALQLTLQEVKWQKQKRKTLADFMYRIRCQQTNPSDQRQTFYCWSFKKKSLGHLRSALRIFATPC